MSDLDNYAAAFSQLRRDGSNPYPEAVRGKAPHKPLLLLAVLDDFASREEAGNEVLCDPAHVPLSPGLCDLFAAYWQQVMPPDWRGNMAMPFYHLTSEPFWTLVARRGSEQIVRHKQLRSIRLLHEHTDGARLDTALAALIAEASTREVLRRVLIEMQFDASVHATLYAQGTVHAEAYRYSRHLVERARRSGLVSESVMQQVDEPVRDRGFRIAIVETYRQQCAFCRLRIRTPDNYTAVEAAHIKPWSRYHDDELRNGLALCKLCHWVFDNGMAGVNGRYGIILAPDLTASYNHAGHLLDLEGKTLHLPTEAELRPDPKRLAWHRRFFELRA